MRFVDKITKSKYFQKATETEFIKKKMEEVSNTPLLLTVEVQELQGMLAVNIPPPPTDRIWYVKEVSFLCYVIYGMLYKVNFHVCQSGKWSHQRSVDTNAFHMTPNQPISCLV